MTAYARSGPGSPLGENHRMVFRQPDPGPRLLADGEG
jgi:hypothetical protein